MRGTTVTPGAGPGDAAPAHPGEERPGRGRARLWRDPVTLVTAAATGVALGLRLYQLSRPGYLSGLTEYDDGPYFGSAVRLLQGSLPYRDYVLVQPPGITLLMVPAALVAKAAGTAAGMAAGRLLTTLASTAGVVLAGLVVRHRGPLTALIACGVAAVYPDGVAAAHTVLVEPWLVLFCLAGAVTVFDGDRLTASRRRLAAGGAAFGFAGAVEAWAVIPVLVIAVLLALPSRRARGAVPSRRAGGAVRFAAGVAAGFAAPVLPFAVLAPARFYQSLIVAQVGPRAAVTRVPVAGRLKEMTGLSDTHLQVSVTFPGIHAHLPGQAAVAAAAAVIMLLSAGGLALVLAAGLRPPTPLESFALGTAVLVAAVFLWPSQFHYHFCAFLGPFLALAIALPVGALPPAPVIPRGTPRPRAGPATAAAAAAGVILVMFTYVQARTEARLAPLVAPATIADARRAIPAGSCVATDEVSLLILADRFVSDVPGCSPVLDGLGTDLALSGGLKPATGAGRVPAVASLWRQALTHARFAWFSRYSSRRVAWTPALRAYFRRHFTPVLADARGDALYQRSGG